MNQNLATSNAMIETLSAMTKLKTEKLKELGGQIVDNTGLTPGLATSGSAGINGLDVNTGSCK